MEDRPKPEPDPEPAPPPAPMFTRAELLGGLPARRASTMLFAIEARAAQLAAASRINRASYAGERTAAERESQFLAAMSAGGNLAGAVSIVDIERFAPEWSSLVPPDAEVRAAIARMLGAKYRFRARDVPRIRAALGLDGAAGAALAAPPAIAAAAPGATGAQTAPVAAAFQRLHGAPIESIYAGGLPLWTRVRWSLARVGARFDRLPPFWIAFFIGLTETLGEGIMAVPVALAGLGPLPGVILLLLLGALNIVTLAALTESVTRSGSMRYGTAYFGRLVRELIGRLPSRAMSIALAVFNLVTFFVYLLGFGSVLTGATGIPLGVWIAGLFVVNVVLLRKETLDDTVASAAIIGTINVGLVVAITIIAALNVEPANLAYADVPLLNGRPIDGALIGLVFGVLLVAFFAHTAPANAAKMVLTLDPSGRSLLWGNLASLATVVALYCAASVAILGVLGPEPLLATRGTAITPLGDAIGPVVHLLGSAYVILAIGIGSLYVALGLYNQVIELLPSPAAARAGTSRLARLSQTRRGRLLIGFAPAALVTLALEVVVLTGQDSFAGPIGLAGVLVVPLVTGVFPLLLVLAARRKAEYVPGAVLRLVGHPVIVLGGLLVFLLAVLLHGLVIWHDPIERVAALAVAAGIVGLIVAILRGRVLRPRAVVEVRRDLRQGRSTVSMTADGRSIGVNALLVGANVGAAELPAGRWRELRVWSHEVTSDGWSVPLAASIEIQTATGTRRETIAASSDPVVVAVDGQAAVIRIQLVEGTRG